MNSLNQSIFQHIYNIGHRGIILSDGAVFFAEYLPYLLVLGFLLLVYYQKGWRTRVYLFCEASLAIILSRGLIAETIQYFYHHPRPFSFYSFAPLISESGWSFPSEHATLFFALAMSVWFINRKWGWSYFFLAIIMGLARIYAGVHWPLDVLGGALIGILSALFVHWLLRKSRLQLV